MWHVMKKYGLSPSMVVLSSFFLLGHDYPAGDQRKDTGRFMVTNGLEQGEYNGSTLGRMAARDDWDNSTVQQRWLPDWFK